MATTTNYGWDTPDDTDLVKDGAAAIRTLGSSVDTTTKALNPSTTLGDIEYRSATANTNTRLALGTAGQVLQVNSGATAPEWGTAPSGGMTLLSTTTMSGTTTTVSSISGAYNKLLVIIQGISFTTGGTQIRIKYNNANNMGITGVDTNPSTDVTVLTDFFRSQYLVASNTNNVYVCEIENYANTTKYKATKIYGGGARDGGGETISNYAGYFRSNSAITEINISNSDNYSFNGGTILIYGVK
jgi:hypothetical protein